MDELDVFFERTGYPRCPRAYIIKWLTDYVGDYGIDGFRVDTVKHADEKAWAELYAQAAYAFTSWKNKNPNSVLDDNPFYMMGEVYGYSISGGRNYDFSDKKVDYFAHGFNSLINFELKYDAVNPYETIFGKYNKMLRGALSGKSVVNYLTSHDDGQPFDPNRQAGKKAANVLLLTPGASQIYYGDESLRDLTIEGSFGDATLRSFMNWEEIDSLPSVKENLAHWQKLGRFRSRHMAIGAGIHTLLGNGPYVFGRSYDKVGLKDKVAIGLDLPKGKKSLLVKGFFGDGTPLFDAYSNTQVIVKNGKVSLDNEFDTALLEVLE